MVEEYKKTKVEIASYFPYFLVRNYKEEKMNATLSSKGQITIPKKIRNYLKLKTGDSIQFFISKNGHVELSTKRISSKALYGFLKSPLKEPVSLEEMDEAIKGGASNGLRD